MKGMGTCARNNLLPVLSKKYGETDLSTIHPEWIDEWDYENNGGKKPEDFVCQSNKKVSWICEKGHRWKAKISQRHNSRNYCPYCYGRVAVRDVNDIATLFPELIEKEWDFERNKEIINPYDTLPNSNKNVYWVCERGHHWKAQVKSRVIGNRCPYGNGTTPMRTRLVT